MIQFDLFGGPPTIIHPVGKVDPPPKATPVPEKVRMNRYESLGLDTTKRSRDKSQIHRVYYCVFDNVEVLRGFSLCFAHFVASEPAVARMLTEPGVPNEENQKCDHCRQIKPLVHLSTCTCFTLCPECAEFAHSYLNKPITVPAGTQFKLI